MTPDWENAVNRPLVWDKEYDEHGTPIFSVDGDGDVDVALPRIILRLVRTTQIFLRVSYESVEIRFERDTRLAVGAFDSANRVVLRGVDSEPKLELVLGSDEAHVGALEI